MPTRELSLVAFIMVVGIWPAAAQEKVIGPVRVKIQEEKSEFFEPFLPVDPARRVEFAVQGNMGLRVTAEGKMFHLGFMWTAVKIDNQVLFNGPWQMEAHNVALPKTPSGKVRNGSYSVYTSGKIRITQTVEIVPGKKPGQKQRHLDNVLIRYTIENKDTVPHRIGLRKSMDVFIVDNDGALFAAPNQPGKILDGIELKDKTMPDYLQLLQRPNLQDPGFVGHMTFNLGSSVERPNRVNLTSLRAGAFNNWDIQVMGAGGDSAMHVYWDPQEIKPNAKRELAFALGSSVATSLENEGRVKLDLAGSFEPGKQFTINAFVNDPAQGQSLTLELPANMELLNGKETQPVPAVDGEGNCLVQWQARVLRPASTTLRIHSSLGVTYASNITITRVDGK